MSAKRLTAVALALWCALAVAGEAAPPGAPETVTVSAGTLTLHALLWRPDGPGPFPAVLFNHGGDATAQSQGSAALGQVFAKHGYVFLFLYRRGTGLSADQGTAVDELMRREMDAHGDEARDRLELQLLDEHLTDARAGVAFLRALPGVDPDRVAVAGHAFGGMLALLLAVQDGKLRAAVDFAGHGDDWAASQALRTRLMDAVDAITVPVFFVHSESDSIAPGMVLSTEMLNLDKPRRFEVYPAVGDSSAAGNDLVYVGIAEWESDVFAFLDELVQR
jgi:dienelactone hydrolase